MNPWWVISAGGTMVYKYNQVEIAFVSKMTLQQSINIAFISAQ